LKSSNIQSYDELPLFLNAEQLSSVLGISRLAAYELMADKSFPSLRIGKRLLVQKEQFISWVHAHSGKE